MRSLLTTGVVRWARFAAATLFLGPCLVACSTPSVPNVGSETNWLSFCAEGQACSDGRVCRCGVCTVECEAESECTLGARDTCVAPRGPALADACAADVAPSNVCLPGCTTGSSECGSGFACTLSSCVPSSAASGGNDAGGAGGTAAFGGASSGGSASLGGNTAGSGAGGTSGGGSGQGSEPGGANCTVNDDCASGVCEGEGCGAGQGVCAQADRICTLDAAEYCSCDGVTFTGSGSCPGNRYDHTGPCDDTEVGNVPDGESCRVATDCASGICEGIGCDDQAGTCVAEERGCTRDLTDYCGCDGVTFQAGGNCPGDRYRTEGACP